MTIEAVNTSQIKEEPRLARLSALIYVFGINKDLWTAFEKYMADNDIASRLLRLGPMVERFRIKDRAWSALEYRFGFEKLATYDEIGLLLGGVTRARAQGIVSQAIERLENGLAEAILPLSILEQQIEILQIGNVSINEVVLSLDANLPSVGWTRSQGRDIRRVLLALRALISDGHTEVQKWLPHLTYIACCIHPLILKHSVVAEQEKERHRKWTYEDLAEAVLLEANAPLHYMEIIQRVENLNRRSTCQPKSIHNAIIANPDKFAYVDQGTYGLTSWGLSSVDTYVNIVAEVMKTADKPLSYGELFQEVNTKREIKKQTFQMTLDLHPRFYRSQQGTYGLRAWLPPREKQTLRTPKSLVEDSDSYERVKRGIERGYDIDLVVAQDKM